MLWSITIGVDMSSSLPDIQDVLNSHQYGGSPIRYYFWFLKCLTTVIGLLTPPLALTPVVVLTLLLDLALAKLHKKTTSALCLTCLRNA